MRREPDAVVQEQVQRVYVGAPYENTITQGITRNNYLAHEMTRIDNPAHGITWNNDPP